MSAADVKLCVTTCAATDVKLTRQDVCRPQYITTTNLHSCVCDTRQKCVYVWVSQWSGSPLDSGWGVLFFFCSR